MNDKLMRLLLVVFGLLIGWAYWGRGPSEVKVTEPTDPVVVKEGIHDGWHTVKIFADYDASRSEEEVQIKEDLHDVAVIGPGDNLKWELDCASCPAGTRFRITEYRVLADLDRLADALIDLRDISDEELLRRCTDGFVGEDGQEWGGFRDYLGIVDDESGTAVVETMTFGDQKIDAWVEKDTAFVGQSLDYPMKNQNEMWKFSVEVSVPGYDETVDCSADSKCDVWDPHNFRHGPSY